MIAIALSAGISKRQLLEEFYFDEIFDVLSYRFGVREDAVQTVSVDEFFS